MPVGIARSGWDESAAIDLRVVDRWFRAGGSLVRDARRFGEPAPRSDLASRAGRSASGALTGGDARAALRDADAVLAAADPLGEFGCCWNALFTLSVVGAPVRAESAVLAARSKIVAQGNESALVELELLKVRILHRKGDLRSVTSLLRALLRKALVQRDRALVLRIVWSLAEATRVAGGTPRVVKGRGCRLLGDGGQVTPGGLMARGGAQVEARQFGAAVRTYLDCGELLAEAGVDSPEVVRWRPAAVETLLRLGRAAQAERLAEENLERARLVGTDGAIGFAQYVLASTRPGCERASLLVEAVGRLQDAGQLLDEALARYELGKALRKGSKGSMGSEDGAADRQLLRAIQLADDCGAWRLAERARAVAGPAMGALRGLTTQERKVARLVAAGLSNPEIANQLFLARRTVEFHLSGVYRKLGLTGRHDLIQLLSEGA
ncbi:helix-turn-helix transcriptional regulator [Kribbella ginsengisoli]|uniref:HTH luxR-type domain-containing protein n=1 Tax=Kribbella ginsengisoli TaxID=363865 RepID=A0ABP6X6U0_9ACTN